MNQHKKFVSFRGVAHNWLCDHMGHMNTRHHVAMLDDAGMNFLSELGYRWSDLGQSGIGWVDAKNTVEYRKEVMAGSTVLIHSGVTRLGDKSITIYHEMRSSETDALHATMEAVYVSFDLSTRRSTAIPEEFRRTATAYSCVSE